MCGTCSNENAIKMMFMKYMHKQRNGRVEFNSEEIESTMLNQSPGSKRIYFVKLISRKKGPKKFHGFFFLSSSGSPKLSILAFRGSFHGRTVGLLSCSNSRPIHGVDIPTLPWPKAGIFPPKIFEFYTKLRCL